MNKNTNTTKRTFLLGAILLLSGCGDMGEKTPVTPVVVPSLRAVWQGGEGIGQFLAQRCTPCHTSQSQNGFNVTSHANFMANGDVIAGNADDSYLTKKLTGDPQAGQRMPPGGPFLTSEEIDTIKAWINDGAANN